MSREPSVPASEAAFEVTAIAVMVLVLLALAAVGVFCLWEYAKALFWVGTTYGIGAAVVAAAIACLVVAVAVCRD